MFNLKKRLLKAPDEESVSREKEEFERIQIATCIILLEVAKSDDEFSSIERTTLTAVLQKKFELSADAIDELTKLQTEHQVLEKQKIKDILAVHLRYLHDRSLRKKITDLIQTELVTAEYAVSTTMRDIASNFAKVPDSYISERATDIYDIERRLLKQLLGSKREDIENLTKEVVIVARELSPTQTAGFNKEFIKGMATDAGGRTSHTAIVARSLGIPAVVALQYLSVSRHGEITPVHCMRVT